jgi:hypothetical protein
MAGNGLRGRSAEFWFAAVGTVAGLIGAAAAVAVFVIPAKTDDQVINAPTTPSVTLATSESEITSGALPETATPTTAEGRYLADLQPRSGAGFLKTKGQDLSVSCPTNQSDDVYHEVSYALPAAYAQFATQMAVAGAADPEATASIQVFIQHRADRSDVQAQVGDPVVLKQGASMDFTRPLGEAVQLTLRARCASSTQIVQLKAPRITR